MTRQRRIAHYEAQLRRVNGACAALDILSAAAIPAGFHLMTYVPDSRPERRSDTQTEEEKS